MCGCLAAQGIFIFPQQLSPRHLARQQCGLRRFRSSLSKSFTAQTVFQREGRQMRARCLRAPCATGFLFYLFFFVSNVRLAAQCLKTVYCRAEDASSILSIDLSSRKIKKSERVSQFLPLMERLHLPPGGYGSQLSHALDVFSFFPHHPSLLSLKSPRACAAATAAWLMLRLAAVSAYSYARTFITLRRNERDACGERILSSLRVLGLSNAGDGLPVSSRPFWRKAARERKLLPASFFRVLD